MDGSRFDGITRVLATGQTRRRALLGLAGSSLAGVLGLARVEETSAACVKPNKKGCKGPKNGKCCQGSVCKGGNKKKEGKCACSGGTKACGSTCANTKTDKNNCGACGNKCQGSNTCQDGVCTGDFGCPAGIDYCAPGVELCPDNPNCVCATDREGGAHCSTSSTLGGGCSNCQSNDDCAPGLICIRAAGCNCPNHTSLCMAATCNF